MPVLVRLVNVSTSRPENVITCSTAGLASSASVIFLLTASVRCSEAASCRIGMTMM